MDNPIVKIIRFLVFIPLSIIVMGIINLGLGHLFIWFIGLSKFWFIVILLFLSGTIWSLFKLLASFLIMLASLISPSVIISLVTFIVLSIANGIYLIYKFWNFKENYSGWETFGAVLASFLVVELTWALITGTIAGSEEHY